MTDVVQTLSCEKEDAAIGVSEGTQHERWQDLPQGSELTGQQLKTITTIKIHYLDSTFCVCTYQAYPFIILKLLIIQNSTKLCKQREYIFKLIVIIIII